MYWLNLLNPKEMDKIDINKKYRTADGREVCIFTTESPDAEYPVVGVVRDLDGLWSPESWTLYGEYVYDGMSNGTRSNLIEVKEKKKLTGYVNVYKDGCATVHLNKATAEFHRKDDGNCIACIPIDKYNIEYEENEGL
jgi:hypothetical protein